mgnify:FL=1
MVKTFATTTALVTAFAASSALAAASISHLSNLPDNEMVTVSGLVTEVENRRDFTIADRTAQVEIRAAEYVDLDRGDFVTVKGYIDNDFGYTDIEAANVIDVNYDLDPYRGIQVDDVSFRYNPDDPYRGTDMDDYSYSTPANDGTMYRTQPTTVWTDRDAINPDYKDYGNQYPY